MVPRDFVSDAIQVSKHLVEFHADDSNNIFSNNPTGLCFLNDAQHFRPEVTVIFLASSLPGVTERLAGEAPGKQSCSSESGAVELEDVGDEERAIIVF
jgi:hypothetical protein